MRPFTFGKLAVQQSKTQHQQRDAHNRPGEDGTGRPLYALVGLLRAKPQEILLFVCHFCNDGADLVHRLFSRTLQHHSVCGSRAFILAEIDCLLKLRQFLFHQRLQYLYAFLLIRIVGSETLQIPNCLIDVLNRRTVR